MEELKKLQQKRLELANKIRALADKQAEWTAEDQQEWDRLNKDYDETKAKMDELQAEIDRQETTRQRIEEIESHARNNPRIGRDGGSIAAGPRNPEHFGQAPQQDQRALALQGWLRAAHDSHDVGEVTAEHVAAAQACGINLGSKSFRINLHRNFGDIRNALSGQTGSVGGYTFGETFVRNLEEAMLAFGGMLNVAEVIRTGTGEPLRWPTANDTTNTGRQIGENKPVAEKEMSFGQAIWNAYKFTSDEVLVPFELLRDSAFNLAAVISGMLGERLGRIQNTKYTTGDGANTPLGIVPASATGVTAASATAIAFDELIDLEHSIDPSRRRMAGSGYMFHDSILQVLRKLKDGEGRYLWQAGANTGAPDTLNTYPYQLNQDMDDEVSSGKTTVIFGQLTQYKIRQVGSIRLYRLTERHRENDQDAFLAFIEGDGNLLNAGDNPVKKLIQP